MHACGVADLLESDRVIFPVNASVLSAFGTLVSPVRIDLARSLPRRLDAVDEAERDGLLDHLRSEGRRVLLAAGVADDSVATFMKHAEVLANSSAPPDGAWSEEEATGSAAFKTFFGDAAADKIAAGESEAITADPAASADLVFMLCLASKAAEHAPQIQTARCIVLPIEVSSMIGS